MNWLLRILVVGLIAGIVHIAAVLSVPAFSPQNPAVTAMQDLPVNQMALIAIEPDDEAPFELENPDMAIAVCRFDARKAPVRFSGPLPNMFWSLTIYDDKGRNVFALNHAQKVFEAFDLVIDSKNRDIEPGEKTLIIQNVTATGLLMLHIFRSSAVYAQTVSALSGELQCSELQP
ncbi:MAG: hypothetical protein C0605_06550 [Hyphomicrobiales bacterium]|nr:MAG: hypothetical protein C0605_06550 [Hyphomicrobiales bacterium]